MQISKRLLWGNDIFYRFNLFSAEPTCGSGQSFKTVYPGDCSKYYDCSKGVLTVKPCSVYQKFDPTSLECRFDLPFDPVNCNNIVGQLEILL